MKITFLNTFGAIALTGLSITLLPTNTEAHDMRRPGPGLRCLPHGARCVTFRGERCWNAGGRYFRCNPVGVGYVEFTAPVMAAPVVQEDVVVTRPVVEKKVCVKRPVVVKKTVVEDEAPVVEEQQVIEQQVEEAPAVVEEEAPAIVEEQAPVVEEEAPTVEEQPALEEEDTTVETLPTGVKTVTIAGERCWVRGGIYYRHCARGFRVCHLRARPFCARPVVAHGPICHAPRAALAHPAPFRAAHPAAFHKGDRFHN